MEKSISIATKWSRLFRPCRLSSAGFLSRRSYSQRRRKHCGSVLLWQAVKGLMSATISAMLLGEQIR